MTGFNLPSGCSESDIPGNTLDDAAWDDLFEDMSNEATDNSMDVQEVALAWGIGLCAFLSVREHDAEVAKIEAEICGQEAE